MLTEYAVARVQSPEDAGADVDAGRAHSVLTNIMRSIGLPASGRPTSAAHLAHRAQGTTVSPTLQGGGAQTGRPAVFCRFAGGNAHGQF